MRMVIVFCLLGLLGLVSGCASIDGKHLSWWGCSDPVRLANAELIHSEAEVRLAEADRYHKLAARQDNILSELERDRRGLAQSQVDENGQPVSPVNQPKGYDRQAAQQDCAMIEASLGNITRLATGTIINETSQVFRAEIRSPGTATTYYSVPAYGTIPAYIPYGMPAKVIVTHPSGTSQPVDKVGVDGFTTRIKAAP